MHIDIEYGVLVEMNCFQEKTYNDGCVAGCSEERENVRRSHCGGAE